MNDSNATESINGIRNVKFTSQMKKDYTILAPDIFPTHLPLVVEVVRMYGYKVDVLRYTGKKVIDTGLAYVHNDMCYPAICSTGQQLYALKSGDYDPHKVALIQFQTGGGCRASNYIWLLRKALHNMGMDFVPVLSLSFNKTERSPGFRITPMMIAKGLMALVYGDLIMLLKNQVLPYEKNKGAVQSIIDKWTKTLTEQFRRNKGLVGASVGKNMRAIIEDFAAVEKLNVKKTKVGVVGEIYVKYSPLGNNGLEDFLLSQDCEFMVPGVLGFFQYMFDNMITDHELYGTPLKSLWGARIGASMARRIEKTMLDALKDYPQFAAPTPFARIRELGDKTLGRGVKMGEGWLLPAEIAELIEKGYDNVICAQPFGCLPNHIVAKGAARTIRELYPTANLCPIDYDAGASKVNQENRIKLMLAIAKEKENEQARN